MATDTSTFRNGLKIEIDGEPFTITYFQHVKPGKGGAFVRTKIKNRRTGRVVSRERERANEQECVDEMQRHPHRARNRLVVRWGRGQAERRSAGVVHHQIFVVGSEHDGVDRRRQRRLFADIRVRVRLGWCFE